MRLSPEQIMKIKAAVAEHFGSDSEITLFGSRVDDSKKGGDYDFLIETSIDDADEIIARKIDLLCQLQTSKEFEDEKIDLVVKRRFSTFEMPIYEIARLEGIRI